MTVKIVTSTFQVEIDKHRNLLIIHSDIGLQTSSAEFNVKYQKVWVETFIITLMIALRQWTYGISLFNSRQHLK